MLETQTSVVPTAGSRVNPRCLRDLLPARARERNETMSRLGSQSARPLEPPTQPLSPGHISISVPRAFMSSSPPSRLHGYPTPKPKAYFWICVLGTFMNKFPTAGGERNISPPLAPDFWLNFRPGFWPGTKNTVLQVLPERKTQFCKFYGDEKVKSLAGFTGDFFSYVLFFVQNTKSTFLRAIGAAGRLSRAFLLW